MVTSQCHSRSWCQLQQLCSFSRSWEDFTEKFEANGEEGAGLLRVGVRSAFQSEIERNVVFVLGREKKRVLQIREITKIYVKGF